MELCEAYLFQLSERAKYLEFNVSMSFINFCIFQNLS